MEIYAFDPTPISMNWIKEQCLPEKYHFHPIGIGSQNGKEKMYLPESHGTSFTIYNWDVSNKDMIEAEMESLASIMNKNGHGGGG